VCECVYTKSVYTKSVCVQKVFVCEGLCGAGGGWVSECMCV
jgi:hypothetical protein